MKHASYAYPSEIVPFVALALTAFALLLLLWRPARLELRLQRLWRRLSAVGPRRAVLVSAVIALLASGSTMVWLGFPVPHIMDEFGFLLLADTFAQGRLANPPPRVPAAFEAAHTLVWPAYSTRYPPVQGLVLAIGQLLGHPGIGVCLSAALLAAAACWFLQGWLRPPWPLLGSLLAAVRVGVASYWGQSYWGGTMTAIGAMLVYGALPRLWMEPPARRRPPWPALALGLFLLANSRPLEGAVAALPAAVIGVVFVAPRWRESLGELVLPLTIALSLGGAVSLAYNRAVTGDPWLLPYQHYIKTYAVDAPISFASPPPPVEYSSPVLKAFNSKRYHPEHLTWAGAMTRAGHHFAQLTYFVCGLPLLICAVSAMRRPNGWKLFCLLCAALPALLHSVTLPWGPHYGAAATGPLLLLSMMGMRELAAGRWRGRRLGPWLPAMALLVQVPLAVVELPAHRPDPDDWSRVRERIDRGLERRSEASLVVVDDRLRTFQDWVCNRADLDRARVLWIQDLGPGVTRRVAAAYAPRRVWKLVPTGSADGVPRLQPYGVEGGVKENAARRPLTR